MPVVAQIGPITSLLEAMAAAVGAGVVVSGYLAAVVGMLVGRSRKEMEDNALRGVFWGGVLGTL
jgi:hypothetical protein